MVPVAEIPERVDTTRSDRCMVVDCNPVLVWGCNRLVELVGSSSPALAMVGRAVDRARTVLAASDTDSAVGAEADTEVRASVDGEADTEARASADGEADTEVPVVEA